MQFLHRAVEARLAKVGCRGWIPEIVVINSLRLASNVAIIQFTGMPRREYVLQASDSLQSAGWVDIGTSQANAVGIGMLQDAESKNHPMRFYRIASP